MLPIYRASTLNRMFFISMLLHGNRIHIFWNLKHYLFWLCTCTCSRLAYIVSLIFVSQFQCIVFVYIVHLLL